jgi:S1-C subfamily serine protease
VFSKTLRMFIGSLSLIMVGFVLGGAFSTSVADEPGSVRAELITEGERLYADVYNRVAPGVVSITTSSRGAGNNDFFASGAGSGFVVDKQGRIVTNYHVIEDAQRIEINFFDGTIVEARVIGTDPDSDLAVIQVSLPPEKLFPVPLGNSNDLLVGQSVLAMGNPFNKDWTLTYGIVSALNRTIIGLNNYSIGGVIQTDAAINPGNSGGPLLNLRGEVIGVNSQIELLNGERQNAGVGYAIPSNLVARVFNDIINFGQVQYSYIGITSLPIDLNLIEEYRLPNNVRGVAVRQVRPNTPAARGGLQTKGVNTVDIITAVDGVTIRSFDELVGYLSIYTRPAQTVQLTVFRAGAVITLNVTLDVRPG